MHVLNQKEGASMPLYEHIYLARQDVSPQQVEEMTNNMTEVLTQGGGKVTKNEYWGLKSLSYRIKKNRKAHYSLLNIDAPAPAVAEMERQMRINEDILRFMTVRVDELEEGPSAMLQKRDRDDERGDRPGGRPGGGFDRGPRPPRRF
jgi:small subunit ribosomal protein S6